MGVYRRQQFDAFTRRLFSYLPSSFVLNDREAFAAFAARVWDYISQRISLYWLAGWIIAGGSMIHSGGAFNIFAGIFVAAIAGYNWSRTDILR